MNSSNSIYCVRDQSKCIYGKIKTRILPMLFMGLICAYIDRANISFAQLRMAEDLNFSHSVYGLGAGIFFIGYVIFEIPSIFFLVSWALKYGLLE
jgi:ACS family tartrate transporter-like MFS transporter